MPTVQGKHVSKSNAEFQAKYSSMPGSKKRKDFELSYSDIDSEVLQSFIQSVCSLTGAVMMGKTSDGGAYAITVFMGDVRRKYYPTTPEELDQICKEFIDWVEGETDGKK